MTKKKPLKTMALLMRVRRYLAERNSEIRKMNRGKPGYVIVYGEYQDSADTFPSLEAAASSLGLIHEWESLCD